MENPCHESACLHLTFKNTLCEKAEEYMARENTALHISSKVTILQISYNFKLYLAKTVIFVNNAIYLCWLDYVN